MANKIPGTELIEEITSIIETTADLHKALDLLTDTLDVNSLPCQILINGIAEQHEALDKLRNKLYITKDPLN